MKETVKRLCLSGIVLGLGMGLLLLICAPVFVSLFIADKGKAQDLAVLGLRLFAAGLIPCCINNALKYAWQASGRAGLTEIVSLLEGAVFPALAAFVLSRFMQTTGAWLAFAGGEILMLLAAGLLIRKISRETPWKGGACLLLKKGFGAKPEETLETSITSLAEVTEAALRAEQFCLQCGQDARISSHIALCIEEMAGNVIQYGFRDGKPHHLSILLLSKPDHWVLRFRDDCSAFDPIHYTPAEDGQAIGIRLVQAIAQDAHYTYSMNLNNLALILPKE